MADLEGDSFRVQVYVNSQNIVITVFEMGESEFRKNPNTQTVHRHVDMI